MVGAILSVSLFPLPVSEGVLDVEVNVLLGLE